MSRYELIVFDWDGTIMDSAALIAESMQVACSRLGMPEPSTDSARYVIGMGMVAAVRHIVPDLHPEKFPLLLEHYRSHYLAHEPALKPFEGIGTLLRKLDEQGYWLAVATGKPRVGLERGLDITGYRPHFVATRCADESHPKPHPEMLQQLMEVSGVRPSRTLMIGDTSHDLMMAAQAGVDAVAVTYGAQPRALLVTHPARAYLDSVQDLAQWLENRDWSVLGRDGIDQ